MVNYTRTVQIGDSWSIQSIAYDKENKRLRIHFSTTDTVWVYENVPPEIFMKLILADSVGECFNTQVRDHFPTKKIV